MDNPLYFFIGRKAEYEVSPLHKRKRSFVNMRQKSGNLKGGIELEILGRNPGRYPKPKTKSGKNFKDHSKSS